MSIQSIWTSIRLPKITNDSQDTMCQISLHNWLTAENTDDYNRLILE